MYTCNGGWGQDCHRNPKVKCRTAGRDQVVGRGQCIVNIQKSGIPGTLDSNPGHLKNSYITELFDLLTRQQYLLATSYPLHLLYYHTQGDCTLSKT